MIRIYDNRFRKLDRSPIVYQEASEEIVGLTKEIDTEFLRTKEETSIIKFPAGGNVTLIATPFREGSHYASKPTDFVPLIEQLRLLHKQGFVHGDIRGFGSWLIDFDFGGKVGEAVYPPGYKSALTDGCRFGEAGEVIKKWQDWYALGSLIFHCHRFYEGQGAREIIAEWQEKLEDCKDKDDEDLKSLILFLQSLDEIGYKVKPAAHFAEELHACGAKHDATAPGATGSPQKRGHA